MSNASLATSSRSRWPVLAIVVMVAVFGLVVLNRHSILAYWWAYQIRQATNLADRSYYVARLVSVGDSADGGLAGIAQDDRAEIRSLAIPASQGLSDVRRCDRLIGLLSDDDADVRISAATALAFMETRHAETYLIAQSSSSDWKIAAASLAGLGRIETQQARQAICLAIQSGVVPAVRAQAIESMAQCLPAQGTSKGSVTDAHFRESECDPLFAMVSALTDSATFQGPLALEREIAAAAGAVIRQKGASMGESATSRPAESARSVAQIAATTLTSLTGHEVRPRDEWTPEDREALVKQCRKWLADRPSAGASQ